MKSLNRVSPIILSNTEDVPQEKDLVMQTSFTGEADGEDEHLLGQTLSQRSTTFVMDGE